MSANEGCVIQYTTHLSIHGSAVLGACLLSLDTGELRHLLHSVMLHTFRNTCSNRKYIANACNNTFLH